MRWSFFFSHTTVHSQECYEQRHHWISYNLRAISHGSSLTTGNAVDEPLHGKFILLLSGCVKQFLLPTPTFLLVPPAYKPSKKANPYKLLSHSSHTAGKSHCGRRATIHITKNETFSSRDLALRSGWSHSNSKRGSQHNRACFPEPRNCQVIKSVRF